MDLRLGAIDTTNINRKRGRERKTIRKVPSNSNITSILKREYVYMRNARTCDMQKKLHHGPNPNLSAHKQFAHIQMHDYTNIMLM